MNNIIVNRHWHDWTWSISNLPSFTLDGNCVRQRGSNVSLSAITNFMGSNRIVACFHVSWELHYFLFGLLFIEVVQKIIRGQTKSDCSLWDNCKQKWNCSVILDSSHLHGEYSLEMSHFIELFSSLHWVIQGKSMDGIQLIFNSP